MIHRSEIESEPDRWMLDIRLDGVEAYRERPKYGNRHVLHAGSDWFVSHEDQYNAYNVPAGTVNHIAHWAHEKTGINETALRVITWGLALYAGYKISKNL